MAVAAPVWAGPTAADLSAALKLDEVAGILQDEGRDYAASIEREMLPGGGGQLWDRTVERLYERDTLRLGLETALEAELDADAIAASVAFFGSDQGQQILDLENAARRAMTDPDVEDAARAAYAALREDGSEKLAQIDRFVEANDLIDRNVAGALSSHYQFFRGLVDGGAFVMSEEEILADVYGQEEETRDDTVSWLYAFLLMAYQPLDADVMEDYITFSKTDEGRALNAALFEGFEDMYREISYTLGLAASRAMAGSDL
jgi:hypothetical protein